MRNAVCGDFALAYVYEGAYDNADHVAQKRVPSDVDHVLMRRGSVDFYRVDGPDGGLGGATSSAEGGVVVFSH